MNSISKNKSNEEKQILLLDRVNQITKLYNVIINSDYLYEIKTMTDINVKVILNLIFIKIYLNK